MMPEKEWRWIRISIIVIGLALVLVLILVWLRPRDEWHEVTDTDGRIVAYEKTVQVGEKPLLVLRGHGGDVDVHSGPVGSIVVKAHKHGSLQGFDEREVRVVIDQQQIEQGLDRVALSTEPRTKDLDYEVTVPPATRVDIVLDSGNVSVSDVSETNIDTHNGSLTLEHITGAISASTISGDINARDLAGPSLLKTQNGSLRLTGIRGELKAATTSGDVQVKDGHLRGLSILKTTNGSVNYTGDLDVRGNYDMKTTSGNITITLPSTSAFSLNASVGSGNVNNEFSSNSVGAEPQAKLTLSVQNGSIALNKDF